MSSKSVTALLEKSKKLENVLEKRHGHSEKSKKLKNILKKRHGPSEKSNKLKNVLQKDYGPLEIKVKSWKMYTEKKGCSINKIDVSRGKIWQKSPEWL